MIPYASRAGSRRTLGLFHRARKSVEDKTALHIRFVDALGDDADDGFVGDETANVMTALA